MNLPQLPKQKHQLTTLVLENCPQDKSITHRAYLLAAIIKGKSCIISPLDSKDTQSTLRCLKKIGLKIQEHKKENCVTIEGHPLSFYKAKKILLPCDNSGTTVRHLLALLSGSEGEITLTGDASLRQRPMKRILDPLELLGARFSQHTLPLTIKKAPAGIKGGSIVLPIASAQVKSALLLCALLYQLQITLKGQIQSRNHTENFFHYLKLALSVKKSVITFKPTSKAKPFKVLIPADPSSSIYYLFLFYYAQDRYQHIQLKDHYFNLTRCYSWIMLKKAGIKIFFDPQQQLYATEKMGSLHCFQSAKKAHGFSLRKKYVSYVIDDIPLLILWGLFLKTPSHFQNIEELFYKESNRMLEMRKIFACFQLEHHLQLNNYDLKVYPLSSKELSQLKAIKPKKYKSDDHRMLMVYHCLLAVCHNRKKLTPKENNIIAVSNPYWESDCDKILS